MEFDCTTANDNSHKYDDCLLDVAFSVQYVNQQERFYHCIFPYSILFLFEVKYVQTNQRAIESAPQYCLIWLHCIFYICMKNDTQMILLFQDCQYFFLFIEMLNYALIM